MNYYLIKYNCYFIRNVDGYKLKSLIETKTNLVQSSSFTTACNRLKELNKKYALEDFENLTIT